MSFAGRARILPEHITRLANIEAHVHYGEPPPLDLRPFVVIERGSPILLSAPHGCRTFRSGAGWHQEEEYTTAIVLLLSEICGVSAVAALWRTDDSDPNDSAEEHSAYKRALRKIIQTENTRCVIDLHGASGDSARMAPHQLVDLGLGIHNNSLPSADQDALTSSLEQHLGAGVCNRSGYYGFPAGHKNRIRAFCRREFKITAVQIEIKPALRVVQRRVDATSYGKPVAHGGGPYAAGPQQVTGMLQALADFISYLQSEGD